VVEAWNGSTRVTQRSGVRAWHAAPDAHQNGTRRHCAPNAERPRPRAWMGHRTRAGGSGFAPLGILLLWSAAFEVLHNPLHRAVI